MSKAKLIHASIHKYGDGAGSIDIMCEINNKNVSINGIPGSNELIKELTALFKRHLPAPDKIEW